MKVVADVLCYILEKKFVQHKKRHFKYPFLAQVNEINIVKQLI